MRTLVTNTLLDALISEPDVADALIGDLTQVRTELAERIGARAARRWHLSEVLRSVPSLMCHRLRIAPVRVVIGAFLVGPALIWIIGQLVNGVGWLLSGTVLARWYADGPGLSVPEPVWVLAGLLGGVVAGAVVARTGGRGGLATALWIPPALLMWWLAVTVITLNGVQTGDVHAQDLMWGPSLAFPFQLVGPVLGATLTSLRSAGGRRRAISEDAVR